MNSTPALPKETVSCPVDLAASQNVQPEFLALLSRLGLEVVVIRFAAPAHSPIWKHGTISEVLSRELEAIQAGAHDSSFYSPGEQFHFFHVNDLGKAMQQLKAALAALGLLEISTLLHVETAREWRVWFPATAQLITDEATT